MENKLIDICRNDLRIANEKMNIASKIKISIQLEILLKEFEGLHRKLSKYLTTKLKLKTGCKIFGIYIPPCLELAALRFLPIDFFL